MKNFSLKMDENLMQDIKEIAGILNISCSEFIRNAVKKEIDAKRKKDFVAKITNVEYCDIEEEKKIIDLLNNLSEDDVKFAKREIVEL